VALVLPTASSTFCNEIQHVIVKIGSPRTLLFNIWSLGVTITLDNTAAEDFEKFSSISLNI